MLRSIVAGLVLAGACAGAMGGDVPDTAWIEVRDDTAPLTSMPREPMWLINCFSGERDRVRRPEENHAGIRGQFRGPEGAQWLVEQIREGYAHGARSFFIARPMGTDGESQVPGAAWLTIPREKRIELQEQISRLVMDEFEEPVRIYYFIGSYMEDPRRLRGRGVGNDDLVYRFGDESYEALVSTRFTLGGLMSAGAAGFGFDASAPPRAREHYLQLAEELRRPPFNLQSIGEGLPVVPKGRGVARDEHGDFMVDEEALHRMAWVGTVDYMNYRFKHLVFGPGTRVFKWYDVGSSFRDLDTKERRDMIRWDVEHGMIPITGDPVMFQAALEFINELTPVVEDDQGQQGSDEVIPRFTLGD